MAWVHSGLFAGAGAFFLWGLLPLYWKELYAVPPLEILAHRIVWAAVLVSPILLFAVHRSVLWRALTAPRIVGRVALCAVLIGCNWGLYVWSIIADMVIEASLGAFINPLLSMLLGALLLGERLTRLQRAAISLAAVGVAWNVGMLGHVPWLALTLALTFALYGFFRKGITLAPLHSLLLETFILLPVAGAYIWYVHSLGQDHFLGGDTATRWLLVGTGLVTFVPLWLFAYAVQRLRLGSLGLLQYLSPTNTFLLGVVVFAEPITAGSLVTFACIWGALVVYTYSLLRQTTH